MLLKLRSHLDLAGDSATDYKETAMYCMLSEPQHATKSDLVWRVSKMSKNTDLSTTSSQESIEPPKHLTHVRLALA